MAYLKGALQQLCADRVVVEIALHRGRGGVTRVAVRRERSGDDAAQGVLQRQPGAGELGDLGASRLFEQALAARAPAVHPPPGGELPEDDAGGEDVGAGVDLPAARV